MAEKKATALKKSAPVPEMAKAEAKPPAKPAPSNSGATAATPVPANSAPLKPASVVKPVSAGDRARMVAEAAYFIAEKRGFTPGCAEQHWAEAEGQIAKVLNRGR